MQALEPAKTLVDQVYETILDALCDGTFKPGERIAQEDVAGRLNVSRQPVTHALAVLKAQGFLEASGRQGLTVAPIDPALFQAIYQLRSAIEPLAVRLAAARLDPESIRRGREIVTRGHAAVRAGDTAGALAADIEFHLMIHHLSGNALIAETMRLNWQHLRRAMSQVLRHPGMSAAVWDEHEHILEAMIGGDGEDAAEAMRGHLVGAYERVKADLTVDAPARRP
jgi:DNA-binding GntR family transcriptional regulator